MNSTFADYCGDWFIPFVGEDVVAECISKLQKVLKGANLGLKCVRMRLAAGLRPDPLGDLERSPDRLATIGGCLLLRGREGKRKREGRGWKGRKGRGGK